MSLQPGNFQNRYDRVFKSRVILDQVFNCWEWEWKKNNELFPFNGAMLLRQLAKIQDTVQKL